MSGRRIRRGSALGAMGAAMSLASASLLALAPPAAAASPESFGSTGVAGAGQHCSSASAPEVLGARPDAELDRAFTDYGNSGQGWTGADSTFSVLLPGGRELWMFSDTFLGPVNADGSRPQDTPFLHSSFVVQDRFGMRTITGGTAQNPQSLLAAGDPDTWYWLGAGIRQRGQVDVTFLRFKRTGSGLFDFAWDGTVLGRFDARTLKLQAVTPLPSSAGVEWSSFVMRRAPYTYIYGVEDLGAVKYLHIARMRGTDLADAWQYWTGSGWSNRETDSARVMDGVANEYSVTPYGSGYLLITQDTTELLSPHIVAYFSCSPTGPFTDKQAVYTTPETGAGGSYGNANVYTYNAHAHPELSGPGTLVISYNVNSFDTDDLYADVSIYRPRFITVRLSLPAAHDPAGSQSR